MGYTRRKKQSRKRGGSNYNRDSNVENFKRLKEEKDRLYERLPGITNLEHYKNTVRKIQSIERQLKNPNTNKNKKK